MTDKLREAAQAIVDRWDSPAWGGSAENLRHTGEYIAALRAALAQQDAQMAPQGPEFTDTARAALLWVLWHHQGGSSHVGQPIRFALGLGAHDRLNEQQIAEAKRWAAQTGSTTADFHAPTPPAQQDAQAVEKHLADDERVAALCDLSYVAGMKAGWNFCVSDDSDGFERRQNSVGEAIRILKSHRAPTPPAQQDAQAINHIPDAREMVSPTYGSEEIRKLRETIQSMARIIRDYEAAPTPAPKPLGWLDRKAVECLQGAELIWMPAWNRPTSSDPVPIFLSPPAQRVMLTDEEIEDFYFDNFSMGQLKAFAHAVIEAYERKNGISQPGYTAPDMASQGASQFRAGHDAAQSEIAELEQENRLLRARNDRLQKEIEQKGER